MSNKKLTKSQRCAICNKYQIESSGHCPIRSKTMQKIDKIFTKQEEKDKICQLMQSLPDMAKELHYDCRSSYCYIKKVIIEMKSDTKTEYINVSFHPKYGYTMQTIGEIYGRGGDWTEVYYGQKHGNVYSKEDPVYVFTNVYCRDCFMLTYPKTRVIDILNVSPVKDITPICFPIDKIDQF